MIIVLDIWKIKAIIKAELTTFGELETKLQTKGAYLSMHAKTENLYPTLMAELARAGMTVIDLSATTCIPYSTLMGKIRGRSDFTLNEAVAIRKALCVEMSIDELFVRVA